MSRQSIAIPSFKQGSAAVNRRPPPPLSGQLSFGGSESRREPRGKNAAVATPSPTEEIFSLVPGGDSPAFSMIIKLAPSMVDEIRRVEAEGGKARIKFDSNSNPATSTGNIIEVGGREFRFMWSQEVGDLCDIYEERQSGEDGNRLLVESGCAWRKLNVQRILDESTKKHVKKMSEEAERKLRLRGTIVLEPGNSSIKDLAAVEAASRKNYNKMKEAAPKKRNAKSFQVGGSLKSTLTPGSSSGTAFKGKHSSPLSFIAEQPTASSSPLGSVNIAKINDDSLPLQMIGKADGTAGYVKGVPAMAFNAMGDTSRGNGNDAAKPIDLQSTLISLLRNKPQGLTLKALEKAVQVIVPNPLEKIKPILRNIARYKSPGRYILLPGVDSESLNKPQAEIESSSNGNHGQKPDHQELNDLPALSRGFKEKVTTVDLEEPRLLNSSAEEESKALTKINFLRDAVRDNEGDRSNSGGDTGIHSVSSARTCGSCDSESDASFNEEGVNEDADMIITNESNTNAWANANSKQHGTEGGTASYPVEERRQTTNSLEAAADRGKGPRIADEDNGYLKGEDSPDDDSLRYLKYEKAEPEFKGPIKTMAQYQEYVQEYNEKYPDYASLLKNVEGFRSNFQQLCNDLEAAKNRDEGRYREILGQLKETYELHVPHHKRLKMIFVVLHKELEHMKQMISDFANAQNKKNARNKRRTKK